MLKKNCRMCKSQKLKVFLDLGFHAVSDGFLTKEQLDEAESMFPLRTCICTNCGLVQLDYVVPPDKLYRENYPYLSSITKKVLAKKGKAAVITGTNVFAHIDDLDDCMHAVQELLAKKGIFVFELPYLVDLLENLEYDTIYHEHLSYMSIKPLVSFFARFNMEVFDVERTTIHGGSIRVFVAGQGSYKPQKIRDELIDLVKEEK